MNVYATRQFSWEDTGALTVPPCRIWRSQKFGVYCNNCMVSIKWSNVIVIVWQVERPISKKYNLFFDKNMRFSVLVDAGVTTSSCWWRCRRQSTDTHNHALWCSPRGLAEWEAWSAPIRENTRARTRARQVLNNKYNKANEPVSHARVTDIFSAAVKAAFLWWNQCHVRVPTVRK